MLNNTTSTGDVADASSNHIQRRLSEEELLNIIHLIICPVREDYIKRLIIFVLFIVFGVLGNVTLLIVIIKDRSLRNAPNILISNLAIADLLYILVTGTIHFENEIHPCWFSGRMLCAFRNYAPVVFRCACAYSLVALSRERYSVIVKRGVSPVLKSNTKIVSLLWAIFAWVLGMSVASPILTTHFTTLYDLSNITVSCQTVLRGSQRAQVFEICKFVITYAIPVLAIAVHCSIMSHFLVVSTNKFKRRNDTIRRQNETRMRLAYMTIIIPIFFCVLSLPNVIFEFMFHFKPPHFRGEITFRHFSYFMSLANSSLNPWLVFFLSSTHRERLKWCITCRNPSESLRTRRISQTTSVRIVSRTQSRVLSFDNFAEKIRIKKNSVSKDASEIRLDVYKERTEKSQGDEDGNTR